jgi:hypothetical protein
MIALPAFLDVHVSGSLTLGDIVVGIGTLAVAIYTARLARATYRLDDRSAARERKRREREVRGAARLIDAELDVLHDTLEDGFTNVHYQIASSLPHDAWDRSGRLLVETLPEDEALDLISVFADILRLERWIDVSRASSPAAASIALSDDQKQQFQMIVAKVHQARHHLRPLAYPDARDLEPDPDWPRPLGPVRRRAQAVATFLHFS